MPDTPNDKSLGTCSAHSRYSSQQWIPPPPTVQGGGGSPPLADSYVGMHQSTPAVPEESESAQLIRFPTPIIATSSTQPCAQYQASVPGLAPDSLSLIRRSSEIGNVFDAQNAQRFKFRTQYPIEDQLLIPNAYTPNMIPGMSSSHPHLGSVTSLNRVDSSGLQDHILAGSASSGASHDEGNNPPQQGTSSEVPNVQRIKRYTGNRKQPAQEKQLTPSAHSRHLEWSDSSQATSGAQHSAAGPSYMVPVPSSHTHRNSVASLGSLLLRSSPGLHDDLVGASPLPGSALDDPEPPQKRRRTGERKRNPEPKDPIAAERLQLQRLNDDVYTEMLYNLFVPKSVGQVPKKDRLRLSTSQSLSLSSDDDE
jgi:hypothetical protein